MLGNGPCDDGSIPESDAAYEGAGDCAWYCDEDWAYIDPERYNAVTGETLQDFTSADLNEYITLVAKQASSKG